MQHTKDLGEERKRAAESRWRWYSGELLKCFRDERFSVRVEKEVEKNPRGFVLYIDACQHTLARSRGLDSSPYGARSDSWGFLTSCLTKIHPPTSLPGPKIAICRRVRRKGT